MDTISIIGLTDTGTQAARQLLATQPECDLTVYDRDPVRGEVFRGQATLAGSPAEALRESHLIVLALSDSHEIDRVLQRYSDGDVNAPLHGKHILDLCPHAEDWGRRLAHAIRAASGIYRASTARELPDLIAGAVASRST
ncbi:NAD(P)-dependent oxidoreductase [Bordetella holmesii]|nr:NAD binding domain of 6-phosphogluconate dehydrogenase family protein [Bordetella holmesii ATCC 51541]AIT26856.1 NAD binding domain of 6-phosphogluconate dehydrogenase family protein [Bordetella holmesii 44057]AMD45791.1 hypothetical protein H558_09955 [Bordetella holmesii H558]AOB34678.1 hypothetical protein BBB42_03720 [Bordetella holmesii]EWM43106.1 NAD binding domain of 6-phosphogluconate dehydrogenase family protein [Bordetella holmesii 41130]EWM47441.1 NAD binding domain of 6-phosphog